VFTLWSRGVLLRTTYTNCRITKLMQALCMLSDTLFTITALPWKRRLLLPSRLLLVAGYRTTVESWPVQSLSRKLTFCVWGPSAHTVIFQETTSYETLFKEMLSMNDWNLMRSVKILCFWTLSIVLSLPENTVPLIFQKLLLKSKQDDVSR
jgi:hypothetical protein